MFLSELDSEKIFNQLKEKVQRNQILSDEELMQFIILPLAYHEKEQKQEKIRETVELAVQIQDKGQQIFTLAGILVFTDKVIDKETASKIRRAIEMTQIAQIFEEEKQQALTEEKQQIVMRMIEKNYPTEEIISLISSYSQNDVEMLRRKLKENSN